MHVFARLRLCELYLYLVNGDVNRWRRSHSGGDFSCQQEELLFGRGDVICDNNVSAERARPGGGTPK